MRERERHDHKADRFNRRNDSLGLGDWDHDLICDQMIMGDSIAMALASVYIREPYENIVAYVEDNLNTPVITADDNDD